MKLKNIICKEIMANGPITVARFMEHCLYDKKFGYYMSKKNVLGTRGDFITAPEISQVFGELIGVWLAKTWIDRGKPKPFSLVELGPGNGTLMWDITRSLNKIKNLKKTNIILIEKSDNLVSVQKKKLRKIISKNFNIKWLKKPRLSKKESYFSKMKTIQ